MVRVKVKPGRSYVEDEQRREKVHTAGEELLIPRSRVNHCVEVLEPVKLEASPVKPDETEKGKPQHRMIESPRGGGRKS
jgi:hypothetical protein